MAEITFNEDELTNHVLQQFGGMVPEEYLSFEDVKREVLYERALQLQKLGIAGSNKTVTSTTLTVTARDAEMPTGLENIIPAAVEYQPTSTTDRYKVSIVGVDDIPAFEGSRAIAFYGIPMRTRLSWDSWTHGTLYLYYDPIEDLASIDANTDLTFPPAFWTYLIKKTALGLCGLLRLKIGWKFRAEEKEQGGALMAGLAALENSLTMQTAEWKREFERWINQDLNQMPYLRRSNVEIMARAYSDTSNGAFEGFE